MTNEKRSKWSMRDDVCLIPIHLLSDYNATLQMEVLGNNSSSN